MKNFCNSFFSLLLLSGPLYSMERRLSLSLPLKEVKEPISFEKHSSPIKKNKEDSLSEGSSPRNTTPFSLASKEWVKAISLEENPSSPKSSPRRTSSPPLPLNPSEIKKLSENFLKWESEEVIAKKEREDFLRGLTPEQRTLVESCDRARGVSGKSETLRQTSYPHLPEKRPDSAPLEDSSASITPVLQHEPQHSEVSRRIFPIYSSEKILEWEDKDILKDALENCPPTLKEDLLNLMYYATKPKDSNLRALPINRIILEGPSGSGKTTLAQAIVHGTKRNFSYIKSNELSDSFKKGFITIINDLFDPFLKNQQPGAIILEEFGSFANEDKRDLDYEQAAVSQLWQKIDEAKRLNPLLLILFIANDLSKLPDTLCTRLGKKHRVEQPSLEQRINTFHRFLGSSPNFSKKYIQEVAKRTSCLSRREINDELIKARNRALFSSARNNTQYELTPLNIDEAFTPYLQQAKEQLWVARKKRAYEILKASPSYLIPIILAGIGFIIQQKLNYAQALQTAKIHAESIALQEKLHRENLAASKGQHAASLKTQSTGKVIVTGVATGAGTQVAIEGAKYVYTHGAKETAKIVVNIVKAWLGI